MFLNLCYHTKGMETMNYDDALMKISVKSSFSDYRNSLSMFHNIVDFVSRVGANTASADDVILEGQERYHQAENFYLDGNYDQADAKMADALMVISEAMDRATRAKDRALTWIYISEWMATMGVALFSGIVLWWLMVRRRLYHEIPTTELDRSG